MKEAGRLRPVTYFALRVAAFLARLRPSSTATALAAAAVLAMSAHAAQAEVIVVSSSAPQLKSGQILSNAARIAIPGGASIVVVLPSGATRTINGPFEGKASELTRGVRTDTALFNAVKKYVRTGGADKGTVGAMRSAVPRSAAARIERFSWREIPVNARGDICVEKGAQLSLIRPRAGKAQSVTVVNLNSNNRAKAHFAASETSTAWPSDLAPENGSFAFLSSQRSMRQIRLRLITPLPTPSETLRVLHGQRCQLQFQAYLASIMKVANR